MEEFILPDLPQETEDFKFNQNLIKIEDEIEGGQILMSTQMVENRAEIDTEQLTAQKSGFQVCLVCSANFGSSRKGLLAHELQAHPHIRPFKCTKCSKPFKTVDNLKQHYKKSHPGFRTDNKPLKCSSCTLTFKIKEEMLDHKKAHISPKQFVCDICGIGARTRHDLQKHMQIHTGLQKTFKCTQCSKTFKSIQYLRKHTLKPHSADESVKVEGDNSTGLRHWPCGECGRGFSKKWLLKRHKLNLHSGPGVYPCSHCTFTFVTKEDRTKHLKSRIKEKKFVCDLCDRRFAVKSNMIRHRKNYHEIDHTL